ncbi:class D sortase [Brevibacillus humidisoli]|uniref:class D sortase n=1 Tax=Brevibacillus humidisoli TaxID=2895522 RepID=UPI001E57F42A|nr:class D sortase [Brevibacillus humidisoli]UFJ40345.1 class D sortase [Brevibacillus humidisoli]
MPFFKGRAVTALIWLFLFSGISLICYPFADRWWQEKEQTRLLNEWKQHKEKPFTTLQTSSNELTAVSSGSIESTKTEDDQVLGVISIDKIGLEEVILPGTDEEQLRLGIGKVEPDRTPGEVGNLVLAGHRSWTHGKQFSRLNELSRGDLIRIQTDTGGYVYSVTDSFLVTPYEIGVLDNTENTAEITLITCDPPRNPTHRLIVKGNLVDGGE